MKKKNIIIALALTLSLGVGATAYADSTTNSAINSNTSNLGYGFGRITGMRGYDFMINLLKNKFGISESDINNARNSNKTMYDLAVEKGISADQFKSTMVEERIKAVDEAVNTGSISKEQGDAIKTRIKENSASCIPGQGSINGNNVRGLGRGKGRGNGLGTNGNVSCPYFNSSENTN